MTNKLLAIFDLYGTLYDTKEVNYRSYKEALSQINYNVDVDLDFYSKYCNSIHYKLFLPKIAQGISEDEMNYVHSIKKDSLFW